VIRVYDADGNVIETHERMAILKNGDERIGPILPVLLFPTMPKMVL